MGRADKESEREFTFMVDRKRGDRTTLFHHRMNCRPEREKRAWKVGNWPALP